MSFGVYLSPTTTAPAPSGGIPLLSLLVDHYAPSRLNLKPSSAQQIAFSVKAFERFHGRTIYAQELDEGLLLQFIAHRKQTASAHSARRNMANLVSLWRYAHRRGFCARNVPGDLERVRIPQTLPTAWDLTELGQIFGAVKRLKGRLRGFKGRKSIWWAALLPTLYETGARVTAILGLRREDVDTDAGTIVLRAETAKTGVAQLAHVCEETSDAIAEVLRRHDEPTVFPWHYHKRQLWTEFKTILRIAGVDAGRGVAFHRLRKTHATQVCRVAGWELARTQLGHSSEGMTRRYVDPRLVQPQRIELPKPFVNGRQKKATKLV